MKNDYQSVTTDIPAPVIPVGKLDADAEIKADVKSDESGENAEIKAQDAVIEDTDAEADDTDVDAGEGDQEEKSEEEKAKPKKKGGFQKKLEKQAREIEALRQEIARQQSQPKPVEKMERTSAQIGEKEPNQNDYENHIDFYRDHSRWSARQELSAYQKQQESKAQELAAKNDFEKTIHSLQSKVTEFKKEATDFDDVISDVDDIHVNYNLQEAIATSELGPKLMYELAKDRKTLERIASLPTSRALVEIGRFEASLSKSEEKKLEVKTKTAAPPPPKPVGTKSPGKVIKDPSEMSGDEYLAWKRSKK